MKRSLKSLVSACAVVALAAVCSCALFGCDTDESAGTPEVATADLPAVTIGTLGTEDILPMWVAEDEGLFSEAGLDAHVQVFQSATELIAAVSAGEVDLAMTDDMVTASIYASGTDVQISWITLGTDPSQGRFGIMSADDSIQTLSDLAGVPIGVGSNTILEYVMDSLMADAGIADADIVTEELQKLPVRFEAMASGQVKAAALPGSLLALGEAKGFHVVADDTQGDNLSQSVMIVRSEFVADDAGAAALTICQQAWDQAVEKINAAPEDYRALLVEKASLSEDIAATYPISTYPTCQMPEQEMVDSILTWMKGKGYLADAIAYDAKTGTFSGR